jgi:YD repeat-containing protein
VLVRSTLGKTANYKYNGDELVYSCDVDGNVYEYDYDTGGRHDLVRIRYSDKTTMDVTYYPISQGENVRSVKDRDGSLTLYSFRTDVADGGHKATGVEVVDARGGLVATSFYEYFARRHAAGEEYTAKMVTDIDGDRTATEYDAKCGTPILIVRNGEDSTFAYDAACHVTRKATPTEVTELTYDPKASKVSRVVRYPRSQPDKKTWASYRYDEHANLVYAESSEGKKTTLTYDEKGRIATIVDEEGTKLVFEYNENSKPTKISQEGVGAITIEYTASGEIKKVDSSGGREISMRVTSAFQKLLDIIRPAGVTLSF